ncbi:MAG TPA: nucleotidyltransferase family protein [Gemmatimonadales bacterium]|nr:nucleotidyltransferase family protein [Gemmatimonadales bacterium]
MLETLRFRGGLDQEALTAAWTTLPTRGLGLARLVEVEGCALWLERRLRQLGRDLPETEFRAWLARRARRTTARNLLVDEQVAKLVRLLRAAGIPHVLLKGAARRAAAALYPLAEARATNDVDVLVPAAQAQAAWDGLRASGYELAVRPRGIHPGHFHLPPLWDRSRVAVELHTSTSPTVPSEVAWHRANADPREVEHYGMPVRVPSATELLWHGLTHSLGNGSNGFRLRFLMDGAVIWASGADLDWPEIRRRLESSEITDGTSAAAWLYAAAWLAGTAPSLPSTAQEPCFDLRHALRWRFAVLRFVRPGTLLVSLVVGEGTRSQLGLGLTAPPRHTRIGRRTLRRLVAASVRVAYLIWRAGWDPRPA